MAEETGELPTAPPTYQGSCLPSPPPSEGPAEPNATSWKPKLCESMVFVTILVSITVFVGLIIQSLEDTKNPHAPHYGIIAGILLGATLSFLCVYLCVFRQQETRWSQFLRLLGREQTAYRIMEREDDDDETDDGGNATGTAAATAETETVEQKAGNTVENAESPSEPSEAAETAEPKSTEKSEIQQPPVVETQSSVDKLSKLAAEVSEILDQSLLQVELSKSAMESGMQNVKKVSATKIENGTASKGLSSNSVSQQKTEMEPSRAAV